MNETKTIAQKTYCTLLIKPVLKIMEKHLSDFSKFLDGIKQDAERHGYFPDGTLMVEGGDSFHRLWNAICASRRMENGVPTPNLLAHGIWQPNGFVGLEKLQNESKYYALFYTRDYDESLGELGFFIGFPEMWKNTTKDYDLKNLQISVVFKRKASLETRRRFMQCLANWYSLVSQKGIFGEGPIKLISREIEFRGRLAQFRIDVSTSGQDTLNWLLISVLNFGYEVSKVTDFIFDHDQQVERFIGPIRDKVEKIAIE
jgi:hypothetical protein